VKKILVSLHDVTPVMFDRSKALVSLIMQRADANFTILVVPDFHNAGRIDKFPDFCSWLRELDNAGVEIAQHGLYHLGDSGRFSLEGRLLTEGEGEFLQLSSAEAEARISEGYRIMSDVLGKPPSGFTAPAWMYSKGTREVLKQFPFEWIENRWSIEFPDRDNYTVPAVVFASRTPWKRLCSRFWSVAGPAVFSGGRVFRLALHVKDLPALQKSVERALSNSTRHRTCVRCADLVLN